MFQPWEQSHLLVQSLPARRHSAAQVHHRLVVLEHHRLALLAHHLRFQNPSRLPQAYPNCPNPESRTSCP